MVTVRSDRNDFTKPHSCRNNCGISRDSNHGEESRLNVSVDVFIEEMYAMHREKAITGVFAFVAIDEHKNPVPVCSSEY